MCSEQCLVWVRLRKSGALTGDDDIHVVTRKEMEARVAVKRGESP